MSAEIGHPAMGEYVHSTFRGRVWGNELPKSTPGVGNSMPYGLGAGVCTRDLMLEPQLQL